jgi:peptidoglycan/LPS O-acetylase OafA/YrhL
VPAYYASIVAVLLAWPLLFHAPGTGYQLATARGVYELLVHLAFLHALVLTYQGIPVGLGGVNNSWWTLTWEATFYLLLPLIAERFARRPRTWAGVALVAAAACRMVAFSGDRASSRVLTTLPAGLARVVPVMAEGIIGFGGHFAVGMLVAWHYVHHRSRRAASWCVVAGIVGVAAAHVWIGGAVLSVPGQVDPHTIAYLLGRPAYAIAFGLLLYGLAVTAPAAPAFARGAFRWLGDRSYGVYLFHGIVLALIAKHLGSIGEFRSTRAFLVVCALAVPGSLLLGALSWSLLERPVIRWVRRSNDAPVRGGPEVV